MPNSTEDLTWCFYKPCSHNSLAHALLAGRDRMVWASSLAITLQRFVVHDVGLTSALAVVVRFLLTSCSLLSVQPCLQLAPIVIDRVSLGG